MPDADDFLGRGWQFPPAFPAGGAGVAMAAGEQDIEQSLAILLATRRGERVMNEDFGCELGEFLFGEISPGLVGELRELVAGAITDHEPRVLLNGVEVDADQAVEGLLRVTIDYQVRATNSRYNLVFPFYVTEAARPPGQG